MFFRIRYANLDRSFYRFVTMHACDGQTDGQTDRQTDRILITIPRLHYMQRGKNVPIMLSRSAVKMYLLCYREDAAGAL